MTRTRTNAAPLAAVLLAFLAVSPLEAQHHPGMSTPLGISMDRMGSGTTWIPDAAPLPSFQGRVGGWDIMGHGLVFAQYLHQRGPRGDTQLGSLNWGMLMASREVAGGMLQFRTMLSLDPASVTRRGYPLLLQTGETLDGEPIHDRQHPHEFWMELGALYLRQVSERVAVQLYLAPSGEPALGPVAFMHRPSAVDDPLAPLGHHWQDATHISFGVATAGVFGRSWKLEASVFNGRDPDESRWDFDFGSLNSYSGRLTLNPGRAWSLTAGFGRLQQSHGPTSRLAFSAIHGAALGGSGQWSTSVVYAGNREGGEWGHSLLLESEAILDRFNTVFGRVELVQKDAEDLVVPETGRFSLGTLSLGYIQELIRIRGATVGLGIRGSLGFVPSGLEPYYGTRHPTGAAVFLRLRAARRDPAAMEGMSHDR